MKTIVAVALALLVLAGCAKAASEIEPDDHIDVAAWRASLVNLGASRLPPGTTSTTLQVHDSMMSVSVKVALA